MNARLAVVAATAVAAPLAHAFPSYQDAFDARYPNSTNLARASTTMGATCFACHHTPSLGNEGSCYRLDLRATLSVSASIEEALAKIELVDSDGDGVPNIREILAPRTDLPGNQVGYFPGLVGPTGTDPCLNPTTPLSNQLETPPNFCYANCDGSTTAPVLGPADFTCYLNAFRNLPTLTPEVAAKHYANCDGSTTAPVLGPADFSCFLNKFRAGC